jgi:hypothetical protein
MLHWELNAERECIDPDRSMQFAYAGIESCRAPLRYKTNTMAKVTVKPDDQNPEPIEVLAKSIIDLADKFDRINSSKLNRKAIVLLLHDASKVNKRDIETILDVMPNLKQLYIKKGF